MLRKTEIMPIAKSTMDLILMSVELNLVMAILIIWRTKKLWRYIHPVCIIEMELNCINLSWSVGQNVLKWLILDIKKEHSKWGLLTLDRFVYKFYSFYIFYSLLEYLEI